MILIGCEIESARFKQRLEHVAPLLLTAIQMKTIMSAGKSGSGRSDIIGQDSAYTMRANGVLARIVILVGVRASATAQANHAILLHAVDRSTGRRSVCSAEH